MSRGRRRNKSLSGLFRTPMHITRCVKVSPLIAPDHSKSWSHTNSSNFVLNEGPWRVWRMWETKLKIRYRQPPRRRLELEQLYYNPLFPPRPSSSPYSTMKQATRLAAQPPTASRGIVADILLHVHYDVDVNMNQNVIQFKTLLQNSFSKTTYWGALSIRSSEAVKMAKKCMNFTFFSRKVKWNLRLPFIVTCRKGVFFGF